MEAWEGATVGLDSAGMVGPRDGPVVPPTGDESVAAEARMESERLDAVAAELYERLAARLAARVPRATYRLQLHAGFTFDHARDLVDYLDALGVSDLYLSPPLVARAGSLHGYDVVDHAHFSEELGGAAGFCRVTSSQEAASGEARGRLWLGAALADFPVALLRRITTD